MVIVTITMVIWVTTLNSMDQTHAVPQHGHGMLQAQQHQQKASQSKTVTAQAKTDGWLRAWHCTTAQSFQLHHTVSEVNKLLTMRQPHVQK